MRMLTVRFVELRSWKDALFALRTRLKSKKKNVYNPRESANISFTHTAWLDGSKKNKNAHFAIVTGKMTEIVLTEIVEINEEPFFIKSLNFSFIINFSLLWVRNYVTKYAIITPNKIH